jgi:hypothetical protein
LGTDDEQHPLRGARGGGESSLLLREPTLVLVYDAGGAVHPDTLSTTNTVVAPQCFVNILLSLDPHTFGKGYRSCLGGRTLRGTGVGSGAGVWRLSFGGRFSCFPC